MSTSKANSIKYPNKYRSDCIIAWLGNHVLISKSALCTKVSYEYTELLKAEEQKISIPAKFLGKFEEVLKDYGYLPPVI